jgi:hypothetical protein
MKKAVNRDLPSCGPCYTDISEENIAFIFISESIREVITTLVVASCC